jgi:hypothetical protein
MDMDESPLVIMKMDTICREDSLGDIAASNLFHICFRRKIPLFTIDIYSEIPMMMCYIGPWCEYVGCTDTQSNENDGDDIFFHGVVWIILFDCLCHDLDTAECEPDGRYEARLIDVCSVESDHQDAPH